MKRILLPFTLAAALHPFPASSQPAPAGSDVDPIRCWWRTTAGAVRIGENFSVVLTCAVLQNDAVQVVPDQSRLDASVAQMAPFEVVAGVHPGDLYGPNRRFFQYEYRLRVISPDVIGKDIPIPDPQIHYRINSTVAANTALQGRDLTYVMPPQTVRVLSLVPPDAPDIRDTANQGFGAAEQRGFRANVVQIMAFTAIALGALVALAGIARAAVRTRRAKPAGTRGFSETAVLRVAGRELAEVQREKGANDWSDALVARALAATRITAATALGRPISQQEGEQAVGGEGRLVARTVPWRKAKTVSGAATPGDLSRQIEALPPATSGARRQLLEDLQHALTVFTSVQYAREATFDRSALDDALARATAATRRVRTEHGWPVAYFRRWTPRMQTT